MKLSLSYDGSEDDSIQSVAELPVGEEIEGSFVWIDRSLRFKLGEVVLCLFGDPKCVYYFGITLYSEGDQISILKTCHS